MGFVGNYAPCGLSPQMYDMPAIQKKRRERIAAFFLITRKQLMAWFLRYKDYKSLSKQ